MSPLAWSWILSCIGMVGMYAVGHKVWWSFVILALNECLWIAFSISTHTYGFILGAVAYIAIHMKNMLKWQKEDAESVQFFEDEGGSLEKANLYTKYEWGE